MSADAARSRSSGPPRERGRQYGEQAREPIAPLDRLVQRAVHGDGVAAVGRDARERAALGAADRGIPARRARGDARHRRGLRHALRGDPRPQRPRRALGRQPVPRGGERECSSYSILPEAAGDGHAYCGQNWDWRSAILDTVVMLRIEQPGKPTIVMQTEAGPDRAPGRELGRDRAERERARRPLRRPARHAAALHPAQDPQLMGHERGARGRVQVAAVALHEPAPLPPRRFRDRPRDDARAGTAGAIRRTACSSTRTTSATSCPKQIEETYRYFSPDSLYRAERIERVLARGARRHRRAMRALIREALSDHFGFPDSVCNHPNPGNPWLDQNETVASSIVDLTTGEYWVAHGNPCGTTTSCCPGSAVRRAPAADPGLTPRQRLRFQRLGAHCCAEMLVKLTRHPHRCNRRPLPVHMGRPRSWPEISRHKRRKGVTLAVGAADRFSRFFLGRGTFMRKLLAVLFGLVTAACIAGPAMAQTAPPGTLEICKASVAGPLAVVGTVLVHVRSVPLGRDPHGQRRSVQRRDHRAGGNRDRHGNGPVFASVVSVVQTRPTGPTPLVVTAGARSASTVAPGRARDREPDHVHEPARDRNDRDLQAGCNRLGAERELHVLPDERRRSRGRRRSRRSRRRRSSVPVGGCSNPITIAAGAVRVTETDAGGAAGISVSPTSALISS